MLACVVTSRGFARSHLLSPKELKHNLYLMREREGGEGGREGDYLLGASVKPGTESEWNAFG